MKSIFRNKYLLANVVLVIFIAGFLITYPYRGNVFVGLAFGFFSAALVGGLADWFAVTAFFRKPLGIPAWRFIRTEIIPRNRERFINDLTKMVTEELLTKENLKGRLQLFDISQLFIDYLEISSGKEELKRIIGVIAQDLLSKVDPGSVGRLVEELIKQNAPRVKISPLFIEALEYSIKHGYHERIMDLVLEELSRILSQPQIHYILVIIIEKAFLAYEKGMKRRKFIDLFIKDPAFQAGMLQNYAIKMLSEIKADKKHALRRELSARLEGFVEKLKTSPELAQKLEAWKLEQLEKRIDISSQVAAYVQAQLEAFAGGGGEVMKLLGVIERFAEASLEDFKNSEGQRNAFNVNIKNYLSGLIDREHSQVGRMVSEGMQRYSNAEVVRLMEERVGNDLQVIRLTGALVGGATGLFIYAILNMGRLVEVLK